MSHFLPCNKFITPQRIHGDDIIPVCFFRDGEKKERMAFFPLHLAPLIARSCFFYGKKMSLSKATLELITNLKYHQLEIFHRKINKKVGFASQILKILPGFPLSPKLSSRLQI